MMFKKISFFVVFLFSIAAVATVFFYFSNQKNADDYAFANSLSFEDIIARSNCTVVGVFIMDEKDEYGETAHIFSVKNVLDGFAVQDKMRVYSISSLDFQEGHDYLLIMVKNDSLFRNEPYFSLLGDLFAPVHDIAESMLFGEPIATEQIETILERKSSVQVRSFEERAKSYTNATDFPTIIQESDLVLEIKIKNMEIEGKYNNSNTYNCEVLDVKKRNFSKTRPVEDIVMITFIKSSVEIGKTYLVMVNQVDEYSLIYAQSSLNSVFSMEDTEAVEEIKSIISGTNNVKKSNDVSES